VVNFGGPRQFNLSSILLKVNGAADKGRNESSMFAVLGKIWRNETRFTAVECGILAGLGVIYIEKLLTSA
jgi:hypothetical protein